MEFVQLFSDMAKISTFLWKLQVKVTAELGGPRDFHAARHVMATPSFDGVWTHAALSKLPEHCSQEGFPAFPFRIGLPLCHDGCFGFRRSRTGQKVAVEPNAESQITLALICYRWCPCTGFSSSAGSELHVPPKHPPRTLQTVKGHVSGDRELCWGEDYLC